MDANTPDQAFATLFRDQCAVKFLEAHAALLGRYAEVHVASWQLACLSESEHKQVVACAQCLWVGDMCASAHISADNAIVTLAGMSMVLLSCCIGGCCRCTWNVVPQGADGAHPSHGAKTRTCMPALQGQWLSPRVVNLTLQYLTVGIRQARTWKLLQPHVPELMQRVLFPLMCFGDEDQELWDDDPLEYIRKVPAACMLSSGWVSQPGINPL